MKRWMVLAAVATGLVGCGSARRAAPTAASGVVLKSAPTEWTKFDAPGGAFTVYFPPGATLLKPVPVQQVHSWEPDVQRWNYMLNDRIYNASVTQYRPADAGAAEPDVVAKLHGFAEYEAVTTLSGWKARKCRTRGAISHTRPALATVGVWAGLGGGRTVGFSVFSSESDVSFDEPLVQLFFARIVVPPKSPALGR